VIFEQEASDRAHLSSVLRIK